MHAVRMTRDRVSLLAALAVLAAVLVARRPPATPAVGIPPATPPAAPAAPTYPLAELNKTFREVYGQARQEVLRKGGPVILVEGDNVVLLRGGRRHEVRFTPELYHTLKAVSHVPLAVYVLLAPYGTGDISDARLGGLRRYREQIATAHRDLEGRLPEATLARQQQMLAGSRQFLDGVLARKRVTADELTAFTGQMRPLVLANVDDSARAEIDALHKQVLAWKAELPAEEWARLRVVVMGSAMPRKDNGYVQYFARLLGEPGEGPRIVYAEAQFEEDRALRLLGTHLLDTEIGAAFFGDPQRMHRDLLSDAVRSYLKQMKFEP